MSVKSATVKSSPRPAAPAGRAAAFGHEEIAALAKALAHPARVKVVEALLRRRSCIGCDLVEEVGLAASTTSEHLRILKEAGLIDPADAGQYIAGLILLGAAPCTAMVFVWSQLARGDANYTLVQVSLNDLVMVIAFAPLVALLLGVTDIQVPWETLLLSVGLYVVIPLAAGAATRLALIRRADGAAGERAVGRFTAAIKPASILGLLATVVLLFGFQGHVIVERPLLIALIAVPLLIQSYGIFIVAYAAAWAWRVPHNVAAPCALIGTSNFFELAVAVAIGLFGLNSGAALVTVVGVLVEVPVMLSLVAVANRTRGHFPAQPAYTAERTAVPLRRQESRR